MMRRPQKRTGPRRFPAMHRKLPHPSVPLRRHRRLQPGPPRAGLRHRWRRTKPMSRMSPSLATSPRRQPNPPRPCRPTSTSPSPVRCLLRHHWIVPMRWGLGRGSERERLENVPSYSRRPSGLHRLLHPRPATQYQTLLRLGRLENAPVPGMNSAREHCLSDPDAMPPIRFYNAGGNTFEETPHHYLT